MASWLALTAVHATAQQFPQLARAEQSQHAALDLRGVQNLSAQLREGIQTFNIRIDQFFEQIRRPSELFL